MKKLLVILLAVSMTGCQTVKSNTDLIQANEANNIPLEATIIADESNLYDDALDGLAIEDGQFELGMTTIRFPSKDDLMLTADLYLVDETTPFIILFHRAEWSRGEYKETALKLNALGYNCLAIDQRSGKSINDIDNRTAIRAKLEGKETLYRHAIEDVRASIEYVDEHFDTPIYLLGSSYSASLVLVVGQEYKDILKGIMAFSPGENLSLDNRVTEFCTKLTVPTFITSGSHESYEPKIFFEAIPTEEKFIFTPDRLMKHGSEILWDDVENNQPVWDALMDFLAYTESL